MRTTIVICVAVCVLAALVTDVSAKPLKRRGGRFNGRPSKVRGTTPTPSELELQYEQCVDTVSKQNETWQLIVSHECYEQVLEEADFDDDDDCIEKKQGRRSRHGDRDDEDDDDGEDMDETDESSEQDLDETDESSEEDSEETEYRIRLFNCDRCKSRGCGRFNEKLAVKLDYLETLLDKVIEEPCVTTTSEWDETTTQEVEGTTQN